MKRKFLAIIMAMVMALSLSVTAFAATNAAGDLTIEALGVTFENDVVSVISGDQQFDAFYSFKQLPDGTNFSSISTKFTFDGTKLLINGVQVATQSPYTTDVDFTSVVSVGVVYINSENVETTKTYYVSAYPSTFSVTMNFEYENARAFSQLSGTEYGDSDMLDEVTDAQKANAAQKVQQMDNMCERMNPMTAAQYRTLTTTVNAGNTPYELLNAFKAARTGFDFSGSSSYISSIGVLDMNSTATMLGGGAGGWMYQVTRGGQTVVPMIGISGWKLIPGDVVTWRYTCDYGYDINAPMW
jgi:hypothetical protein